MNKTNKNQKDIITSIKFLLTCWEQTNDIQSSTHQGDIGEEISKHISEISEQQLIDIEENLFQLYDVIKRIK